MGVEIYTVQYIADASAFVSGARQVEKSVLSVDAVVTKSKKNMKGMFGGAGRSATAAAKNIDKLNAALNGSATATAGAKAALNGLNAATKQTSKSADQLSELTDGWVKKAAAVAIGWKAAAAALKIFSKAAEDAKQHMNEGAQDGLDKRQKARALSGLLGKNTPDDEMIRDLFKSSQASGYKFDEVVAFDSEFEGSIPAGRDAGHITKDQEEVIKEEGKKFGKRLGLDPKIAGDLIASIVQYTDMTKDDKGNPLTKEQGIEKFLGQVGAVNQGLQDGKGDMNVLAANMIGVASVALTSGHVKDYAELASFTGLGSTISKGGASSGITYDKMERLINETQGEGAAFLKTIGVADQVGDRRKLVKLKEHVDSQRKAAPDPAHFDVKAYLMEKGFHEDAEVKSTVGYLANMPALEQRVDKSVVQAKDGNAVRSADQEFVTSLDGMEAIGGAIDEAGMYEQTRKRQRLAALRKSARGQLMAADKTKTFGANLSNNFMDATVNNFRPNTGEEEQIDEQVWKNVRQAAKQAGIEDKVNAKDRKFLGYQNKHRAYGTGTGPTQYGGQDTAKLDEFLNTFGPELEGKRIPSGGQAVEVGVNPVKAQVNGAAVGQGVAGGAPGAGGAGGGGGAPGAGAAAPGMKVASVDASGLHDASGKLDRVLDKFDRILSRSMSSPGSGLGGSYGPYIS